MKIGIKKQKELLKDIIFNNNNLSMKIILETDDVEYFKLRAIEFIKQGDLVKAQMLLNIARYKNSEVTKDAKTKDKI